MKSRTLALLLLVAALPCQRTTAQAVPNFAGKWLIGPDMPPAPIQDGAFQFGSELLITQDEKFLTIVTSNFAGSQKVTYRLDGKETRDTVVIDEKGRKFVQSTKVKMKQSTLVITSVRRSDGARSETTLTLDGPGALILASAGWIVPAQIPRMVNGRMPAIQPVRQPLPIKASYNKQP